MQEFLFISTILILVEAHGLQRGPSCSQNEISTTSWEHFCFSAAKRDNSHGIHIHLNDIVEEVSKVLISEALLWEGHRKELDRMPRDAEKVLTDDDGIQKAYPG